MRPDDQIARIDWPGRNYDQRWMKCRKNLARSIHDVSSLPIIFSAQSWMKVSARSTKHCLSAIVAVHILAREQSHH